MLLDVLQRLGNQLLNDNYWVLNLSSSLMDGGFSGNYIVAYSNKTKVPPARVERATTGFEVHYSVH